MKDESLTADHIPDSVEPNRDAPGIRAEWEGVVCITDADESAKLFELVETSTKYIQPFPGAAGGAKDAKGPLEPTRFEAPDFSIIHGE